MSRTLRKTAVIGIGGTGMSAVLYMKKKLIETYGEVPPMIQFLVIDTTDRDSIETDAGQISLEPGEFLKLEVRNPAGLIATNREVKEWIPDRIPKFALHSGAKQVRSLGRLAVFANSGPLEARLNGLISSVRDFHLDRDEKYSSISDNIHVNIVCSISGGTGSGAMLDIAVLTRAQLGSTDKLLGYLLLPDIFVGKPATENVEPNAYGALKEISHFMDSGSLRYTLGGRTRSLDGGLFNAVYLVNKTNSQGTEYNNINDLKEFLGMGMFLQSSTTGRGATDIIDNLEAKLVGERWFDKPTVFSSFGISELVYPGEWYANLYAKKIALETIQRAFQGGDIAGVTSYTDDFLRRAQLRERNADDVIDALIEGGDIRTFPLPPEFRKEMIGPTFSRREGFIHQVQQDVRDLTLVKLAQLNAEKPELLARDLQARLDVPQGLEFTRSFLSTLAGKLGEDRRELNSERDALDGELTSLRARYDGVRKEADEAAKAMFNAKSRLEIEFKKLKALVDREARLVVEIERRERALDFFAHLLNVIAEWRARLNLLAEYCVALTEELSGEVERLQSGRREIKPFVMELKPSALAEDVDCPLPEEFLRWLRETKKTNVLALAALSLSDLKNVLVEYGASDQQVVTVRDKKIEDILRELSADERTRYIQRLDMMAAPLWQYDQGRIAGEKRTEHIYLFGVNDASNTMFAPDQVRTAISSHYPPSVVSTGDPKRVVCLKVEAAVPAFVIHNVARYKERYMNPSVPFSYHLHRDWDDEIPDLFPEGEGEEGRRYWSLGLAEPFGLIVKRGEYYYVKSEKTGERLKDYLVRLGQGRKDSLSAFVADADRVEEVRDAVEKINGELGNTAVIERLRVYGNKLADQSRKSGNKDEVRQLIELELGDIEDYINSLGAL